MATLESANSHYRRQQKIQALALKAARKATDLDSLLRILVGYRLIAARDGAASVGQMLEEQGLDAPAFAAVNTALLAETASDGRSLRGLLAATPMESLDLMVVTQVQDVARIAAGLSIASRPDVSGYVRMLNAPSCARCAILAAKFYKWSSGFQRHPRCDCRHVPTTLAKAQTLTADPVAMYRRGEVHGLTKAEALAMRDGADMVSVVNARRSLHVDAAGREFMGTASLARSRGAARPRPTPEQIYADSDGDRQSAIRLLRRFGYLT